MPQQSISIHVAEDLIADYYKAVSLHPADRKAVQLVLQDELDRLSADTEQRTTGLRQTKSRLMRERSRLLEARYADAVPLDLMKSEQTRIAKELVQIDGTLDAISLKADLVQLNLGRVFDVIEDAHTAYAAATDDVRREFNQFFFEKLLIGDDDTVDATLTPMMKIVLNRSGQTVDVDDERDQSIGDSDVVGLKLTDLVGPVGLEPTTRGLKVRCSAN